MNTLPQKLAVELIILEPHYVCASKFQKYLNILNEKVLFDNTFGLFVYE